MLVSVIADGIAMVLMPHASIMTEKLARRGLRIHQDYETDVLGQVTVAETMDRDIPQVLSTMRLSDLAQRIAEHDPEFAGHEGMVILNEQGQLSGIITRGDVLRALREAGGDCTVLEAGTQAVVVAFPDESLHDASRKMLAADVGRLPVVDPQSPHHVLGYLGRRNVMAARLHRMNEEGIREPGWVKRFSRAH
ncbi:MAG: CBS domain-containing protein [Acidobacteriales bacterium]|nr:CBS domain-containing protein [Terriglobales bacterium]